MTDEVQITILGDFRRAYTFVNGCAHAAMQEPPFRLCLGQEAGKERYARVEVREVDGGAVFEYDSKDTDLHNWLLAAKAHLLGINVGKPMRRD